jgi:hypothetical protein
MPKKQTRESIEAELNASEFERMSVKFEILIRDLDNLEMRLRELEKRRGIPDFYGTKSLPERMAALGMSKEGIDGISDALDAVTKAHLGKMGEIPERMRRRFDEMADAETSALDQLQGILDARVRKR